MDAEHKAIFRNVPLTASSLRDVQEGHKKEEGINTRSPESVAVRGGV